MGRPRGLARSSRRPVEIIPATAAWVAAILQKSLRENDDMVNPPVNSQMILLLQPRPRRARPHRGCALRYNSHPARRSGRIMFCARSELLAFMLARSQV